MKALRRGFKWVNWGKWAAKQFPWEAELHM